jgi:tRNA (guanine37-N1)-methyltransferase
MRVDLVTLFPELFETFLETSFVGRARKGGELDVRLRSPREHGLGKHRSVDDTPYGGGSGMVMRVDVLVACMEALDAEAQARGEPLARRILLTPQGQPFAQPIATRLAEEPAIMLLCGRYEGFDERVRAHVAEEISLGDFVMTGGEVAAMAIVEATVRLIPGVLGNAESIREESHGEEGLLEYPQYTRPAEFRGMAVPEVLAGGNHAEIAAFRRAEALARTAARRPDLAARALRKHDDDGDR